MRTFLLLLLLVGNIKANSQTIYDSLLNKPIKLCYNTWSGKTDLPNHRTINYNPDLTWTVIGNEIIGKIDSYYYNSYIIVKSNNNDTIYFKNNYFDNTFGREYAHYTLSAYNKLKAKYGVKVLNKLINGQTWIGMSEDQLLIAKGLPKDINTTKTTKSISKQYVYDSYKGNEYYYITNGRLTAIQD